MEHNTPHWSMAHHGRIWRTLLAWHILEYMAYPRIWRTQRTGSDAVPFFFSFVQTFVPEWALKRIRGRRKARTRRSSDRRWEFDELAQHTSGWKVTNLRVVTRLFLSFFCFFLHGWCIWRVDGWCRCRSGSCVSLVCVPMRFGIGGCNVANRSQLGRYATTSVVLLTTRGLLLMLSRVCGVYLESIIWAVTISASVSQAYAQPPVEEWRIAQVRTLSLFYVKNRRCMAIFFLLAAHRKSNFLGRIYSFSQSGKPQFLNRCLLISRPLLPYLI